MPFLPPNQQRQSTEGNITLILNRNHFCTNDAPFTSGNKHTANDLSCSRMWVISYVLNADSGRWDDVLISYTAVLANTTCCRDGCELMPARSRGEATVGARSTRPRHDGRLLHCCWLPWRWRHHSPADRCPARWRHSDVRLRRQMDCYINAHLQQPDHRLSA